MSISALNSKTSFDSGNYAPKSTGSDPSGAQLGQPASQKTSQGQRKTQVLEFFHSCLR
jgi:hypothetical protein